VQHVYVTRFSRDSHLAYIAWSARALSSAIAVGGVAGTIDRGNRTVNR